MTPHVGRSAIICLIALPLGMAAAQAGQPKAVTASVSVMTSDDRRVVAVQSKGSGGEPAFLFCVDLEKPVPQKISFTGPARVVYRPLPADTPPAGVKLYGPENISQVLAVLPADAKGWQFLGKNEKTLLPPGGPDVARVMVLRARVVRRVDWIGEKGDLRGMDVEPCFVSGG